MNSAVAEILPSGLDTLSERALLRATERWTGNLLPADSLPVGSGEAVTPQVAESIVAAWRDARNPFTNADLSQVLGDNASLADGVTLLPDHDSVATDILQEVMLSGESLVGDVYYNVLVLLISFLYLFCFYRYFDDVVVLFRSAFNRHVVSSDRAEERRHTDIFYGSLGKLFMLGAGFVGLLTAFVVLRENVYSVKMSLLMPFIAIGLFVLIILVQTIFLALVGVITRSSADVAMLQRIRLIYFVLSAVLVAPSLLISQITSGDTSQVWLRIGFVTVVVTLILFIRESIEFFLSKKVSILHWILYLCTVEIVPFSLLWQAAVRLGS